jgi:hypothetical protein
MFWIVYGMNWSVGYMSAEQQMVLILNLNVYRGDPVKRFFFDFCFIAVITCVVMKWHHFKTPP